MKFSKQSGLPAPTPVSKKIINTTSIAIIVLVCILLSLGNSEHFIIEKTIVYFILMFLSIVLIVVGLFHFNMEKNEYSISQNSVLTDKEYYDNIDKYKFTNKISSEYSNVLYLQRQMDTEDGEI